MLRLISLSLDLWVQWGPEENPILLIPHIFDNFCKLMTHVVRLVLHLPLVLENERNCGVIIVVQVVKHIIKFILL